MRGEWAPRRLQWSRMDHEPAAAPTGGRGPLGELARLFLRLGTTAFGGPAAHIAMMEHEVVRRRQWLTRQQFLDYLGATNLVPGPNSTELAIHIGHARAGWAGLLVAGVCFIVPAMLIVGALAMAYVRYGSLPEAGALLYGVKPVVIAVVAQALWGLARTAVKSLRLAALGVLSTAAVIAGVHELAVLVLAALAMLLVHPLRPKAAAMIAAIGSAPVALSAAAAAALAAPFTLWRLFLAFAWIGSVLFGSGYVLLAFLRAEFVERLGWLTEAQVLDAIAVGQVTPGPVFTTATFVGPVGGLVATAGIFLPAFIFVGLSGPFVPRLRRSAVAGAILDGVNVASLALMAVVSAQLARAAIVDPVTVLLALASGVALLWWRINSAWLVLGGALIGLLVR
jgi:chromate transporter